MVVLAGCLYVPDLSKGMFYLHNESIFWGKVKVTEISKKRKKRSSFL